MNTFLASCSFNANEYMYVNILLPESHLNVKLHIILWSCYFQFCWLFYQNQKQENKTKRNTLFEFILNASVDIQSRSFSCHQIGEQKLTAEFKRSVLLYLDKICTDFQGTTPRRKNAGTGCAAMCYVVRYISADTCVATKSN